MIAATKTASMHRDYGFEVEVEKELGFHTKKDIEAYGMDKFTRKCVERVPAVFRHYYGAIQAPGPMDGLGKLLLHAYG